MAVVRYATCTGFVSPGPHVEQEEAGLLWLIPLSSIFLVHRSLRKSSGAVLGTDVPVSHEQITSPGGAL